MSGVLRAVWCTAAPAPAPGTVVASGIFDLLHVGHLRFLAGARAAGERLVVGVEDDDRVRARKGPGRPVVGVEERCELLAAVRPVDAVFVVRGAPEVWTAEAYADLLAPLRPAALALTEGDPAEPGKREAARRLGARVVVLPHVPERSTTRLLTCRVPATMADRGAISDLFAFYAAGNDLRDLGVFEQVFTEDATFTLHIAGADSIGPLQPRSAILDFFGQALGAQTDQRRHLITNLRLLEEDDDRARVNAYLTLLVTEGGEIAVQSAGLYETEVVRAADGWRVRSMVLSLDRGY
jgi:cytidyltransferase-like protein